MRMNDWGRHIYLPHGFYEKINAVTHGVSTSKTIITQPSHRADFISDKAKKKRFPTDAQPKTVIPGAITSGIIVKQDKAQSVAGHFTPPGNAVRGRKNEILQGFRTKTRDADRYEKSVCHTPFSEIFSQKHPKSLREFSPKSCLKIAHKQFYRKNEVYPI